MRNILSATGGILLFAATLVAQATPNFSGTWTLDASKSDFGPMPGPESIVMVIDHKEPALKVNVTQKSQMGDATTDSNYTTDGKDNVNKMRGPAGEQDIKSTTKWNGKSLTTARTIEAQGMSIGIDEAWDLSTDGKIMTVSREIKTPQGNFATKMVFNKK
jgi:hypothetical protein